MNYDKKKEKDPTETINLIKKELKKLGIDDLNETFFKRNKNCHTYEALRVSIKNDYNIGQNGKGTTKAYATASAYAEFVERLQGYNLFNIKQPDEKLLDKKTFLKSKTLDFFLNKQYSKYDINKLINICNKYEIKTKKIQCHPFFHINSNTVKFLSNNLIIFNSYSTGIAAGNTQYEALLQGLCEIFERYVLGQLILNPISLPDIPSEEYMSYEPLKKYVEYAESLGLKVFVKDASLNGEYPVVCSIIYDKENNTYRPNFGSHTSLQVAIERCFTESLQGVDLSNNILKYYLKKINKEHNNITLCRLHNAFVFNFIELKNEEFNKTPDWNFSSEFWHKTDSYSNKELVNYWFRKLINRNFNIFVRNMSYIDFSTYQIFIPELQSLFLFPVSEHEMDIKINYHKCFIAFENNLKVSITKKEFLDFCKYYFHLNNKVMYRYKNIEIYYILTLFYTKNINDSLKIIKIVKQNKKFNQYIKLINFIEDYILLTAKKENTKIIKKELSSQYGKKRTEKLVSLLFSNTSFKKIIQRIKKQKAFEKEVHLDKIKDRNKKRLEKNLNHYFKKQKKNQEDLKNLFNTNN